MEDAFLTLFEAAKALVTYIDKQNVFDKAAAGGCSGMDYFLSDKFYDLIVNARGVVNAVENGQKGAVTDGGIHTRLFEAAKSLAAHVEKERAFDKINDMGPVGIETYQSEAFIEVIQKTNNALKEVEKLL